MIRDAFREIVKDDFLLLLASQVVFGLIAFLIILAVVLL